MEREYYRGGLAQGVFPGVPGERDGRAALGGPLRRTGGRPGAVHRTGCRTRSRAIAVEASGPTWAFVDALTPTGATICVVDPRRTKLKAGFAAKTDRWDARRLADALRRASVVSIYVPPRRFASCANLSRPAWVVSGCGRGLAQMIRALLLRSDGGEPPGHRLFAARALAWLAQVQLRPEGGGAVSAG